MKRWLVFLMFFFPFALQTSGQTTTLTTGLPSSPSSLASTRTGITFVIVNSNNYPVRLKSVDIYTASTQSNDSFYLKYTGTALSGPPTNASSWPIAASALAGTIPTTGIHPMFSNMNFIIPANTTYRFLLECSGGSLNYGAAASTPNSFTAGGITIGTGDYTVNGQNVGYSGGAPSFSSFNPRFWCGTIVFEPGYVDNLSAYALVSPGDLSSLCGGNSVNVKAVVKNLGSNDQSNFQVNAFYSGQSAGQLNFTYSGTLMAGTTDTVTIGTLNLAPGFYTMRAYISLPADTVKHDDTSGPVNFTILPPIPLPDTKSDSVCAGEPVLLKILNSGSNTVVNWYSSPSGGTPVHTGDSLVLPFINQDTMLYVSAKLGNCESGRVPIHGALGTPPVVDLGADTSFCQSLPLILDAGNPGGTYRWSNGANTQTIMVTSQSGTYWVEVDRYCQSSDTINVSISPVPVISGISYVRSSNTYHFNPSGVQYATSYLWDFGDGNTSTLPNPVHTYSAEVNVESIVKLFAFNDCGADSSFRSVPTSVQNVNLNSLQVKIYPNPADRTVKIETANIQPEEILVVHISGALAMRIQPEKKPINTLDISGLAPGIYMVKVRADKGNITLPLQILR